MVMQLENWNVSPAILHLQEITGFASEGSQTIQLNVASNSNTANNCRYVVAVLSQTQGWADVQCVNDTPSNIEIIPPKNPSISINSFDGFVQVGQQANIDIQWSDLDTNGYKIVVQLEDWSVSPAILHLSEITAFSPNGSRSVSLNIPSDSNTSNTCRYVVAVLSNSAGWGDVQCTADTASTITVSPVLNPAIQIISYDTTVTAGGQANVDIQWNDLVPSGYKIVVQLENWNVSPAILHLTNITGFSQSGSQTVAVNVAADSNTSTGCRYVAAVLSETRDWGDVQCAHDTSANVEVTN